MKKAQSQKLQSYLQLLLVTAILIVVNVIAQFTHDRFDLTSENRYTLSNTSKEMLRNLDDIVYVKVYLGGELPSGFRRLKSSTREMLNEMKVYAGDKLEYEFIDPGAIENPKDRRNLYSQLADQGLSPVNLQIKKGEGSAQQIIFPGAILNYKNETMPLQLLQSQQGRNPEKVLHNSILELEYGIINSIKKFLSGKNKDIAFIGGHGELGKTPTKDIRQTLSNYYNIKRLNLPKYKVGSLYGFDLAIVAKPTEKFTELDKYKLDQFIMRGGKVIWLVESIKANMDSLDSHGVGFSYENNVNLEDQLFKYGVRINRNLVQDLRSHVTPITRRSTGRQRQRDFLPWPFYPLVMPTNDHPMVNNMSAIWLRFANTIDTVGNPGIEKKPILQTSPYSRTMFHPVRINMQNIRDRMNRRLFNQGPQTVGVLLKGQFNSVFKNRVKPETLETGKYGDLKEKSDSTKMVVISDGDLIRNQYSQLNDQTYELGRDRFTKRTFSNKDFMLNAVDYLLDESGLIQLRAKDFSMRLLNESRAEAEKLYWQIMNMGAPVLIVIIFGILYNFVRKQRFAT